MWRKWGLPVLRISLMLIVGISLYVWFFEKRLIFYPNREIASKAPEDFEDILLGTAVTLGVVNAQSVAGIILEAPFTNIRELARRHAFSLPIGVLFRTRYDSLAQVAKLATPIVIVHAKADPVIPFDMGQRLHSAAVSPKLFFAVDGDIHEGPLMVLGSEHLDKIRDLLFAKR